MLASSPGAVLPILTFDWLDPKIRHVAENIWHAQRAGWPKILTYDYVEDTLLRARDRRWKRYHGYQKTSIGVVYSKESSADEYPFACTKEHRGSIWIGNVPLSEQNEQGRMLNAFFQKNNAARVAAENPTGFRFEVASSTTFLRPR
jgi:hypothetical protein